MIMTLRNFYQGLAIRARRINLLFLGSIVQLLTATLLVFGLAYFTNISGAIIGAIGLCGILRDRLPFPQKGKGQA
jgi:hypothetical protein